MDATLLLVPSALGALCVLLFAAAMRTRVDLARERLLGVLVSSGPQARRITAPALLGRIGRLGPARRLGDTPSLRRRLILAGRSEPPDEFIGRKLFVAIVAGVGMLSAAPAVPVALAMVPVAAVLGFRAPDIVLARAARRRQDEVTAHVADLVEVLLATTEAGLSPPVALRRSVEVMRGPLGKELTIVAREIDLGAPWREALGRLLERTDAPALRRLVAALARSQRLGASVSSTLRSLAEDVRSERRARAEEAARRAPVKMLFPLVFLILPAFLLLTVGPAVLATLRSLH